MCQKKVNVVPRKGSIWDGKRKCPHAKCKSTPVFAIFVGDGDQMMSRLFTEACAKHLPLAVRKSYKYNHRPIKKYRS